MEILLSALVSGLMLGLVLAIMALGLTIIFGVMDMVNFAHGEFLMIGMYAGLLTAQVTGVDPLFGLPVAAVVGFLLGVLCYYGLAKYLLRGPMVAQLLGTFGLMLFLRNLALLIMGSEDRALHAGLLVGKSL
jgi:branched-chain amino acid transport system permease protein